MTMLLFAFFATALAASPPTVHVPGLGDARGTISNASSTVALFLSIPYAEAPIGTQRWQPPTAAESPWASPVLDASKYGNFCVQTPFPEVGIDAANMSEDCLFVNVATPLSSVSTTKQARPLLPVMVRNLPSPLPRRFVCSYDRAVSEWSLRSILVAPS